MQYEKTKVRVYQVPQGQVPNPPWDVFLGEVETNDGNWNMTAVLPGSGAWSLYAVAVDRAGNESGISALVDVQIQ